MNGETTWQVVCGNIGTVYSGNDGVKAKERFYEYVDLSKTGCGRAAYEEVVLMQDDEIVESNFE